MQRRESEKVLEDKGDERKKGRKRVTEGRPSCNEDKGKDVIDVTL